SASSSSALYFFFFFFSILLRPPRSTLFPTRRSSDLGLAQADQAPERPLAVGGGRVDQHARHRRVLAARRPGVDPLPQAGAGVARSEEHTSELQSLAYLVCRLLLEKKKINIYYVRRTH